MYEYQIDDVALLELQGADRVYVSYFARLGDREKGERWAARFFNEYRRAIDELKLDPFRFGKCTVDVLREAVYSAVAFGEARPALEHEAWITGCRFA